MTLFLALRRRLCALVCCGLLVCGGPAASAAYGQTRTPPASPRQLTAALDAVLDRRAFADAVWGAVVLDLEAGEALYGRHTQLNLVPASNAKLFTTAAALDQLGPDYRYRTLLLGRGRQVGAAWRGDLVVRGSGDPTIGGRLYAGDRTRVFRAWADSLAALGIRRVAGDLIGDDDVFDDEPLPEGWSWDDEPYWYAAETGGLVFNDNAVDMTIAGRRRGARAAITWEPYNTDYITVENQTRTLASGARLREGYARARGANHLRISSQVPEGGVDRESLTIANGTLYFLHTLRETLERAGIAVEGRLIDIDDLDAADAPGGEPLRPLASHTSPPMREIAQWINRESINLYAEQALKTLAHEQTGAPGSTRGGLRAAARTFAEAGIDTAGLGLVDGSGLSRMNLVSPAALGRLLAYMWLHPSRAVRQAYLESLPGPGMEGTLKTRFATLPARADLRAKTGTLGHVSALSGYVRTRSGRPLAFVLISNNFTTRTSAVREAQDDFVELLANINF